MSIQLIEILSLVSFLGGVVQGATGLGYGLVVVGFYTSVLNLSSSTVLILSVTSLMALTVLVKHRSYIKLKDVSWVLVGGILARIGAFFFDSNDGNLHWIKGVLGLLLISLVLWSVISAKVPNVITPKPILGFLIGVIGGFIGGVFGVGGPILAIYFIRRYQDSREYTAAMQTVFFILNIETLGMFGASNNLTSQFGVYFLISGLLSVIGVYFGLKFLRMIAMSLLRKIVNGIIVANAAWLLIISFI